MDCVSTLHGGSEADNFFTTSEVRRTGLKAYCELFMSGLSDGRIVNPGLCN